MLIVITLSVTILIVCGGGFIKVDANWARTMIFADLGADVVLLMLHHRRVEELHRHMFSLEKRLGQPIQAVHRTASASADDLAALVHLERRRIHVERRINGPDNPSAN